MRLPKGQNLKSTASLPSPGIPMPYPAPTGGWNTRDALDAMDPRDAVILDNYFPRTGDVVLRGGNTPWATGLGAKVETVMDYSKNTTTKLFGIAGGKIYDASAQGAVGAAAVNGLSNSRWQYTIFTTSGDTRLVLVNGADDMLQYNGAAWAAINAVSAPIAITGVATNTLFNVWQHQRRLFFIQLNSMKAWYLPVDSFGGAAASIDLGSLFREGGYLVAGGTWTRDGGDGMDDLCVFVSSKGEVAIYAGNDPSDAPTNWGLIGRYKIGPPIGNRSLIGTGADIAVISDDGIVGLSNVISLDRAASNRVALSNKICGAYADSAQMYGASFGWEAISYPRGNMVLFNIPVQEGVQQQQYVLNPLTSAWCRFKNWNYNTFALHNKRIYGGGNDGTIYLADEGDNDNGADIPGFIKTAFAPHDDPTIKKYSMVKAILFSDPSLPFGVSLAIDYDDTEIPPNASSSGLSGLSIWNVATWNVDPWASSSLISRWQAAKGEGTCAAIMFATNTKGLSVRVTGFAVLYERGGIL